MPAGTPRKRMFLFCSHRHAKSFRTSEEARFSSGSAVRRHIMALYQAPSFEALERLSLSRDADLARRELINAESVRGRGAQSNRSGRFETHARENFDDGWDNVEPIPLFETREHVERAKTI